LRGGIVAFLAFLYLPALRLTPDQFSGWASAAQAVGVVAALLVAASQLRLGAAELKADNYDRAVERVYTLHSELTSGELNQARRRLSNHLKMTAELGTSVRRASKRDLEFDPNLKEYPDRISTPRYDAGLLLRFFERARLVQVAGSADDPVFLELICRHATWWNCTLKLDNSKSRRGLMTLSTWADSCAEKLKTDSRFSYLADWGETRKCDFGSLTPWIEDSRSNNPPAATANP
jgi:hypothetical protein